MHVEGEAGKNFMFVFHVLSHVLQKFYLCFLWIFMLSIVIMCININMQDANIHFNKWGGLVDDCERVQMPQSSSKSASVRQTKKICSIYASMHLTFGIDPI